MPDKLSKGTQDYRWWDLITDPKFEAIIEYCNTRINILLKENEQLSANADFDSTIRIGANTARIDEIKTFLRRVNYKKQELSQGGSK